MGAGVYALYYSGGFEPYRLMAAANRSMAGSWAIYVGRAEAEGSRKGLIDQHNAGAGSKLYRRILKHRSSIEAVSNLDPADFSVRYLVVAPTWIPLAETVAIRLHQPLWNQVVDGLGNHDPGAGRRQGMRPRWDTVHPGRPWAERLEPRQEDPADIAQEIRSYLAQRERP